MSCSPLGGHWRMGTYCTTLPPMQTAFISIEAKCRMKAIQGVRDVSSSLLRWDALLDRRIMDVGAKCRAGICLQEFAT